MQNTNIIATYDYYTLDQARQIISEENRQKAIRRAERKARKRAETIYYIKQKLSGLIMAAVGIITPILLDGDATFSLFALPVGIWLLFTKEKVMMFWFYYWEIGGWCRWKKDTTLNILTLEKMQF